MACVLFSSSAEFCREISVDVRRGVGQGFVVEVVVVVVVIVVEAEVEAESGHTHTQACKMRMHTTQG